MPALLAAPLLALLPALGAVSGGPSIPWETDYDAALARAQAENKIVFVAVNMDGEKANDHLAEEVYTDKGIAALAAEAVCLIASRDEHSKAGKECKRFGAITCAEHLAVESKVRAKLLQPGPDGAVVSPQHLMLAPDGTILMSAAYQIADRELAWMLTESMNLAAPDRKRKMPQGARPPRRLVMGGVAATGGADSSRPLSEEELEQTIQQIRAGLKGEERINAFFRVLSTDHEDAVDFIATEMKSKAFGRRVDARVRLIHAIGVYSPPSYWEALELYVKDPEDTVRNEVAVALEQLAAEDSVKVIKSALAKEKDSQVKKNLMRALGAAGAEDKSARRTLLKAAGDEDKPFYQINALIALGPHHADKAADEALREALAEGPARIAQAAALGIAFARAEGYEEALAAAKARVGGDEESAARFDRIAEVLGGGDLSLLKEDFAQLGGDRITRERYFGR